MSVVICSLYECGNFQSKTLFFNHPPFSLGRVETSLAVNCKVVRHFVMCSFSQCTRWRLPDDEQHLALLEPQVTCMVLSKPSFHEILQFFTFNRVQIFSVFNFVMV